MNNHCQCILFRQSLFRFPWSCNCV